MAFIQRAGRNLLSAPGSLRESAKSAPGGHYYAIDFARGLAALVVLVWHYQHFFFVVPGADRLAGHARSAQPFYAWLRPFYTNGFFAVQFFWMISGFVFAAVYLGRQTSTRDFVVNRFARLYPLHLLTLLAVALLQIISEALLGRTQIYVNNDLRHFMLNIFFASHWGLEKGYSFNTPVWSVSIEILIYAVFWVTLPALYRFGIAGPVLVAGICWMLHYHSFIQGDEDALRCAFYFFTGTALFLITTVAGKMAVPLVAGALAFALAGIAVFMVRPHSTDSVGMPLFLVGLLLLLCAVEAMGHGHRFRAISWIGDNTYGTYLWHVPIQIATLIILDRFVGSRAIALQPWFFIGFIGLTVLVARLSFLWIEAPAREWIRQAGRRQAHRPAP